MFYYTYMLKSVSPGSNKTYVGYTNNLNLRLLKHNSNKGAKSTKGYKWTLIYSKKFKSKNLAMSYEYKLKKDRVLRNELLMKSIK
ncbi:GIY-YIG nuclease family protein [Candidatus Pelagibacter sp.]|nr:GIY-YIG nuclease family protein [Candidatus Pelagibacter sp.]MDC1497040.1 GIY-YIG nuclease family protein [Pelagibacteraceae bacterium]